VVGNQIEVKPNSPNPFSDLTAIQFKLNTAETVSINVYNAFGQQVNTIVNEYLVPGEHTFYWAGNDFNNHTVPGGVYYFSISTSTQQVSRPMIFINK